jgi:ribosomal protein L31
MKSPIEPGQLHCPNCGQPMKRHVFESTDVRALEVDVCHRCHAIWFDTNESARLSPDGVVDLFRLVHAQGSATAERFSSTLPCARCRMNLSFANDIARTNQFSYYRCPKGHGRLTTFLHFLREKQFVRDLTAAERNKLAAHVRQIRCTSCGGPVDIARHGACTYCGSAVSVLDKDATQKALDHYLKERARHGRPLPPAARSPVSPGRDALTDLFWFDVGTDLVGAFARLAARPASALTGAMAPAAPGLMATDMAALPTLDSALASSGLGDSLSLVDTSSAARSIGDLVSGDSLATLANGALTDGATGALEPVGDVAGDGGLVDLVTDGIGSIVDGLFS